MHPQGWAFMQPQDLVGKSLGHYRIQRQVGYGGMATVFLAEDIHLGRDVTLKVFWPRMGETQDFLRRFAREARVLAQLDHPNILPVYDYGEQGELAYLVTPYMSGGTLKDLLRQRKVLPPLEALHLVSQVLPALQYAHERNLIHRDIKPGNLLFKGDGSLVLADFGLVKVVEEEGRTLVQTVSETGQIAGTPEYMAPEQIQGKAVAASDIYALGIVLYEMVTGQRPFTGTTLLGVLMQHANEVPPPPRSLNPYISPQLQAVILKALEKDPQKRFARPAEFFQALQQISNPGSNPGLRNNPASQPGIGGAGSADLDLTARQLTQGEYGPTQATNWAQPPQGNPPADLQPRNPDVRQQETPNGRVVLPAQASSPVYPQQSTPSWGAPHTMPPTPRRSQTPLIVLLILFILLAGLVASLFLTPLGTTLFGPQPSSTPAPVASGTPSRILPSPTTGPSTALGPTTTACPTSGQSRAAVTATFAPGHDPTIVYLVNETDSAGNPSFGTVKLYNTVSSKKTELARLANTTVNEAQVSDDGQWVLFSATVGGKSELRMVRLDGHGLQTLVCAPTNASIRGSQWSLDQKYVVFDEFPQNIGAPTVYLLNMQSGTLQVEVDPPSNGIAVFPRTWLDYHRVLMIGIVPNSDAPPQNVYVVDISNGAHQSISGIRQIFTSSQQCWDFDTSYDGLSLFLVQCAYGEPTGSCSIDQQSVDSSTLTSVFNSSTLTFNTLRVIDPHNIKLLALSSDTGGFGAGQGDPAHDGLYLVLADNSAPPVRLSSTPSGQSAELNRYSQYFWSNVSRDETLYTLEQTSPSSVDTLIFGPLDGGQATTFASIGKGTSMSIAGWTTT